MRNTKPSPMESLLQIWEDYLIGVGVINLMYGLVNQAVFKKALGFRKGLLRLKEDTPFYLDRLMSEPVAHPDTGPVPFCEVYQDLEILAEQIKGWVYDSKRVFRVSNEIQSAFGRISTADTRIDDLLWPFDSFLVELETPIVVSSHQLRGNVRCSYILVSKVGNGRRISLVPSSVTQYKAYNAKQRRQIVKALENDDHRRALELKKNVSRKQKGMWKHLPITGFFITPEQCAMTVDEILEDISQTGHYFLDQDTHNNIREFILRVVIGLCLFLEAFDGRDDEAQHLEWRRHSPHDGIRFVLKPELVCDVRHIQSLECLGSAPNELDEARERKAVSPHWRRGYWRRPPGKGKDRDVRKSVRVKPTLVRADLLSEGGVPHGVQNNI